MFEKLKGIRIADQLYVPLVLILVGVGSFGLGRLSVLETPATPAEPRVVITTTSTQSAALPQANTPQTVAPLPKPTSQTVVASKTGTKYHLPSCPGAQQIKPDNRIEFSSPEAAKAAGYSPAANCPGVY